jgi:hypothetical protein
MTAKPVRDLLYSKTRNQANRLFESARQVEIETEPKPTKSSAEMMKELMVLNERGSMGNKRDNFTTDKNDSLTTETRQPIVPRNDLGNDRSTSPTRY